MNYQYNALLRNETSDEIIIIYDGECPFCNAYIRMVRLKESIGNVKLIDARKHPEYVAAMAERGMDINTGMLVIYNNQQYYASDALNILALLTSPSSIFNHVTAAIFKHKKISRVLYPFCRHVRNITLVILGRTKIT